MSQVAWTGEHGKGLRIVREARNLTQKELAEHVDRSHSRISELERAQDSRGGPTRPSPEFARKLAEVLPALHRLLKFFF